MIDNGVEPDLSDLQRSSIAGWVLNTIGKAVVLSVAAAFVLAVVAGLSGTPALLYVAGLVGPLVFGVILYLASPPLD